jgi:hypothetical protein
MTARGARCGHNTQKGRGNDRQAMRESATKPIVACMPAEFVCRTGEILDMAAQPDPSLSGMASFPSLARMAAKGNRLATVVSAFAFAFSAVSFFETVLKQANLRVYVTDTLSYTRDPYGGYEVIALPVTIANSGARDGAVVTLQLAVKNLETGRSETLASTYTADSQYFGGRDDVANRVRRPKLPFAPLAIIGRSAYAGTILFYTADGHDGRDQKMLIEPKSKIEMTLSILAPPPAGWIDRHFFALPAPITLAGEVGPFLPGALLVGDTVKIRLAEPPK